MNQAVADSILIDNLKDPKFFIETFLWVVNKAQHRVPFVLNPVQSKYYEHRTHNDLILKARKEGFSTLIEAMFLHACLFGQNENCVTMAHTWDDTVIHMNRVKFFLDNMGSKNFQFSVILDTQNMREIYFPHSNSRYWIGTAGSAAFGRGRDITKLHLSEIAHYQDQTVITGVMEACVPHATKVFETTANGVGEAFFRLWRDASDPQSGSPWKAHFFSWFEDPTNRIDKPTHMNTILTDQEKRMQKDHNLELEQILWYRNKRSEMVDKALMPQEHPSTAQEAFLSSGRHAFDLKKIAEKKSRAKINPPLFTGELFDDGHKIVLNDNPEGRLSVWKMPREGRMYLVSADASEGVQDGDFSVAHVIDRTSWEVVAVWRGRPHPGVFGQELANLGYLYNNAILIPELNNNGWAVVERLKTMEYPHILNTKELWGDNESPKDGFPTNEKTRTMVLTALRKANEEDTVIIPHMVTLEEMETFIQNENNNKFEAQEGCHDDCVISLAIGVYCVQHLTVDESYAVRAKLVRGSPIRVEDMTGNARRKSATGYR